MPGRKILNWACPPFLRNEGSNGTPSMEAHMDETQKCVQNQIYPDGIDKSD